MPLTLLRLCMFSILFPSFYGEASEYNCFYGSTCKCSPIQYLTQVQSARVTQFAYTRGALNRRPHRFWRYLENGDRYRKTVCCSLRPALQVNFRPLTPTRSDVINFSISKSPKGGPQGEKKFLSPIFMKLEILNVRFLAIILH